MLSIATRKAGQVVRCPGCQAAINVPHLEDIAPKPQEAKPAQAERKTSQPEQPPETETAAQPSPPASEPPPPQAPVEAAPAPVEAAPAPVEAAPAPRVPAVVDDEDEGFALREAETEFEEMDLTPMVDVTFLLLIFFMITASFNLQKTIQVPPPDPDEQGAAQAMTMQELERNSIIVEIDRRR